MSMGEAYTQVGNPGDVVNVNQGNTDYLWNMIFGGGNGYNDAMQMFGRYGNTLGNLGQQALGVQYDPNAYFGMFQSQQPTFQRMVNQALTPFGESAGSYADLASHQAMQNVDAQFAKRGGWYSGGAAGAAAEAMAMPYYQAAMQEAQMKSGMLGNLWNTALPLAGQQYANSVNTEMQGIQSAAGMYGNLFSGYGNLAGGMMGAGAALAAPEYWQPSYVENPSYWSNWAPQLVGGLAGAFMGIPAVGEALGEGVSNWLTPAPPAPTPTMNPYAGAMSMADTHNWWQTAY